MYFIGDIHGDIEMYLNIIKDLPASIQIGDFGIGFNNNTKIKISEDHKFIRGNHDNPDLCKKEKNYLGDFGFYRNIFFVSGAYSVDKLQRINGIDWWDNEELPTELMYKVIDSYKEIKPRFVVSHDCPFHFQKKFLEKTPIISKTNMLLDQLLEIHQPEIWVFGHHHISIQKEFIGTRFIGLKTFEVCYVNNY